MASPPPALYAIEIDGEPCRLHLPRQPEVPGIRSVERKVRHGPIPSTQLMFAVPDDETIELAQAQGLELVLNRPQESIQEGNRRAGVTWTRLAFAKAG